MKYMYTPNENDTERLKDVHAAIELLPTAIKSGTVDGKIREVIESHFFDSMQDCFDEYSESVDKINHPVSRFANSRASASQIQASETAGRRS